MIFTTAIVPYRATPSLLFKEKGDHNGYPGTVIESRTYVLNKSFNPLWSLLMGIFNKVIFATAFGSKLASFSSGSLHSAPSISFLPLPPAAIGIHFASEEDDAFMTKLGFVKESYAKTTFYRGSATVEELATIFARNVKMDNFSPAGSANLDGIKAYLICEKVILYAIKSIPSPAENNGKFTSLPISFEKKKGAFYVHPLKDSTDITFVMEDVDNIIDYTIETPVNDDGTNGEPWVDFEESIGEIHQAAYPTNAVWLISKVKHLPKGSKGIFFPYFPGMLISDKVTVPDLILSRFNTLLGSTKSEIAANAAAIHSGWSSAASTESGIVLSHLAFGLKLALDCGAKLYVHAVSGNYKGFYLVGEGFVISAKGAVHSPVPRKTLEEEYNTFDSHDAGMEEIINILNSSPIKGTEGENPSYLSIDKDQIPYPRTIHNLIRGITIPNDKMSDLALALNKISFAQSYWDPRNPKLIASLLETVGKNEFLDDDVPILYKSLFAMTSSTSFVSTLAAFGNTAPSFIDGSGKAVPIYKSSEKSKDEERKNHLLCFRKQGPNLAIPKGEIPIFIKNLQDAAKDFKTMMSNHIISFKVTPRGSVSGTTALIKKPDAEAISVLFAKYFAETKKDGGEKKKRKRNVEDLEPEELIEEGHKVKKVREIRTANATFFAQVAGIKPAEPEIDSDVEMET